MAKPVLTLVGAKDAAGKPIGRRMLLNFFSLDKVQT